MITPLGVCVVCTAGLAVLVAILLLRQRRLGAELATLRARVDRYRGEQRADRVRLDDLEPARVREVQRRLRRETDRPAGMH